MRARVIVFVALLLALLWWLAVVRAPAKKQAIPSPMATERKPPDTTSAARTTPDVFAAGEAEEMPKPPVEASAEALPAEKILELKVIVKGTGEAIPGANVRVAASDRVVASPGDKLLVTGPDGIVNIRLPETTPAKFVLQIYRAGFSGWWSQWDMAKGEKIPTRHTVELERATLIGGYVANESNRPIPDATVRIGRVWRGGESMDHNNQRPEVRSLTVKTDATGKWTDDHVPEPLLEHIRIAISHPDYAEGIQMVDAEIIPDLRAQTWTAILRQGERVAGIVMDTNQNPITGADVAFGMRNSSSRKQTKTDANGRYELKNLNLVSIPRENVVIAMAKGFAPMTLQLTNRSAQGELNFVLAPGSMIRGRVQNREGESLKGVRVNRERSSILNDDGIEWSATTDADGRFEWDGAPPNPQSFSFGLAGYALVRGQAFVPGAPEQTIVMDRIRALKGTVRNAASGEPIEQFYVLPARGTPERLSSYAMSSEREFKQGVFELELDEADYEVARMRAPGYLTAIFRLPAQDQPLNVTLTPSQRLEGMVVNGAGFPVADAEVAAIASGMQASATLGKGRFSPWRGPGDHTVSDQTGRFILDLAAKAESLIAVHPDGGFGEISLDEFAREKRVRLMPWGRLEGTLVSNGKPMENQELALSPLGFGRSGFNTDLNVFKATTDSNGRFTFEIAPPREMTVSRLIPMGERSWQFGQKTNIMIVPGAATSLQFVIP